MNIVFLFLRMFAHLGQVTIVPMRRFFNRRKRTPLPKIDDPILYFSAKQLAEKIRQGELKSEKIIESYIKRIRAINHILNAVIEDRFTEALEDAKAVDRFISETAWTQEEIAERKPLLGVPLTVKESCSLKGLSYAVGFSLRTGIKADEDGGAVARLKDAGAIPILVSATPEFCMAIECFSLINGHTSNAYNNLYSSAGSSGGEGALLGAAGSAIGIGSDLAGSIRVPAMFNGVFGHKPTSKIVPISGHWPMCKDEGFYNYLTAGPIVRYAEDLRLMLQTLNVSKEVDFSKKTNLADLNVFFMDSYNFQFLLHPVQSEIKDAVHKAVKHLGENCGSKISTKRFEFMNDVSDTCICIFASINDKPDIFQDPHDKTIRYNGFVEYWKSLFSKSILSNFIILTDTIGKTTAYIFKRSCEQHLERLEELKEKLLDNLKDDGVFILPTFPTSAFQHKEAPFFLTDVLYALPFNLLGFPSTQVPMGLDDNGLPIGIQVIAAPRQDHLCISVAEELARGFGGWIPPPA